MAILEFLAGLALGIGIYSWRQCQFKRQLQKILNSYSSETEWVSSLPSLSLVRREITYLHQQKTRLENEKRIWQELIEQAPFGYLRIDGENQLLWCNQQARDLLKIDRWQTGQIRLLLELVRSYELDQLIEQTRNSQQPQVQEWMYYFTQYVPSNQAQESNSSTSAVSEGVKSVSLIGYSFPLPVKEVGIFLLNQQPLIELSQKSDRAFADLAHELRTPLTSISLVTENLLKRLQNPERRWVEQMSKEINRLIDLVQQWLELTRLQADPSSYLNYELINLPELIRSVWHTLEPLAQRKKVTLNYSGEPQVSLPADKSRLIQVFLNLLDNGIKHSPPDSQIQVEIELNSSDTTPEVQINIIDSGTGFEANDLPYVFERLYRGDKSRTRLSVPVSGGSGLGLAIVQQIVEAHSGSITAQNHPVTGGGWLKISLPLQQPEKKIPHLVTTDTLPN